ncbi:hypothetical protein FG064_16340 [Vibrio cholerae]|nr:hypothetical protein [Vibrio cholerae]
MVRKLTTLALAVAAIHSVSANDDFARQMAQSQQEKIQKGRALLGGDFIDSLIGKADDRYSAQSNIQQLQQPIEKPVAPSMGTQYFILISDEMGEDTIKQLFNALAHRNDVAFVVRGLLPSEKTITDVGKRIIDLVKDLPVTPNVALDPRPFQEVSAEYAPQILMYQDGELVLSATGLANPNYLQDQYRSGKRGDLGNFGTVVKITERDITEVLKERFMKLDKQQLMADAKDRFWDNVQFLSLPLSLETQTREFVPQMTINDDLIAPDGTVIALRGATYNTLDYVPFTQRLVIFDATDERQLEFVKTLPKTQLRTKYITTRFDRTLKWDAVKYVENQLNAPVYELKPEIMTAFDIRSVPSVVTADNARKVFLISETKLD